MTETSAEHWRARAQHTSARPSVEELLPGLWRLVVPLPGHSVGQVNVYALAASEGVLLIDTGWRHPAAWAALDDLLHQAGLAVTDVVRLLSTHAHPDHCGLAGTFRQEQRTTVAMHAADAACFRQRYGDPHSFGQLTDRWLKSAGVPAAAADADAMHAFRANLVDPVGPDMELHDGQRLVHGRWQLDVLHTPGHTAGHVCLYDRVTRTLFTGDHVLSRINTSPAYRPLSEADPVGGYLASFPRLRGLAVERILPGHGRPFTDLGARLDVLEQHHAARLAAALELVRAQPGTVWEVSSGIPRSSPWDSLTRAARISAVAETYGHLVHLTARGLVEADGDGPVRWRPVSGGVLSDRDKHLAPRAARRASLEGDPPMPDGSTVTYEESDDYVVVITLNRPQVHNAVNRQLRADLNAALERFDAADDARAAVVTGAGRSFSAGRDLKERAADNAAGRQAQPEDAMSEHSLHSYPRPRKALIAAINGNCLAGGFSIAQLCDIRIAADNASLGITEARVGLMAPFGSLLARQIPVAAALELILTAQPVSAQRAYEMGIVNRVVPADQLLKEALLVARQVAANAPLSVQAAKELVLRSLDLDDMGLHALTRHIYRRLLESEDAKEGPRAFAEKRAPRWTGR